MNLFGKFKDILHKGKAEPLETGPEIVDKTAAQAGTAAQAAPVNAAPQQYRQWWRAAANAGQRFRLDEADTFIGYQFGEPWAHARLMQSADGGETLAKIADLAYRRGLGLILCRDGCNISQRDNHDVLFVGYGEIVDFLVNGALEPREPSTRGWGSPIDFDGLQSSPPDMEVLLPYQCFHLDKALRTRGVHVPRVAVLTDCQGTRSLTLNLTASLGDQEQAMEMSGLVNYYLPRYYFQAVFDNDEAVAVYPLLPEDLQNMASVERAEQWRRTQTEHDLAAAKAKISEPFADVPSEYEDEDSPQERQWRKMIASPTARFRLDPAAVVHDTTGMPYTLVHLAAENVAGAYSFRTVALCLADSQSGAIFCHEDWQPDDGLQDTLRFTTGKMIAFLMTANQRPRAIASKNWGIADGFSTGRYSEPDALILPLQCRRAILTAMERSGVENPLVALYTSHSGEHSLHFSGWESILNGTGGTQAVRTLGDIIRRCLPSHYVSVMDEPRPSAKVLRARWPLWPTGQYEGISEG